MKRPVLSAALTALVLPGCGGGGATGGTGWATAEVRGSRLVLTLSPATAPSADGTPTPTVLELVPVRRDRFESPAGDLRFEVAGRAGLIEWASLNRDGDLLSDMVLQMFGSIAGSESMVISVGPDGQLDCLMAEAPHGTAPSLEGLNRANPMAMILAAAGMLSHMKEQKAKNASRAIYEATLETVYDGIKTADIGGSANTDEFTNEVIRRVKSKLEVWSTLS